MKLDSLRSELEEYIENTNKDEVYKKSFLIISIIIEFGRRLEN
ncbi:hypothetical protein HMPREF9417_0866 [Haemophilus parainfluenzae ATCC 33392]|nr:hypothetical protein [Haemophilus parainfluenzae]EGC72449.1 hypothetical protein HMPREF9417_0866 [Haemophilus parainfluenzae ATCC 33392]